MAILRTQWVDDDGSGTLGTVINNAEKQILYDQIDIAVQDWVDISFNAANFVGTTGGSWTVTAAGITANVYQLHGRMRTYWLNMNSNGNTVVGAPVFLNVTLPFTSVRSVGTPFHYWGAVSGTGIADIQPSSSTLNLLRDIGGTAWAAGVYNFRVQIHIPA